MARRKTKKRRRSTRRRVKKRAPKYTGVFGSTEKRMDQIPKDANPSRKEAGFWVGVFIILFLFTSGIFAVFKDTAFSLSAHLTNNIGFLIITLGLLGAM